MGLKKLGNDVTFTVGGESSNYVRNVRRNNNTAKVDTTGLADAQAGYKTYQAGAKDIEISGELMHPADGEEADAVYTAIKAALDNRTTLDAVVFDEDSYDDVAVFGGEDSIAPDEVYVTQFTMALTVAPSGS